MNGGRCAGAHLLGPCAQIGSVPLEFVEPHRLPLLEEGPDGAEIGACVDRHAVQRNAAAVADPQHLAGGWIAPAHVLQTRGGQTQHLDVVPALVGPEPRHRRCWPGRTDHGGSCGACLLIGVLPGFQAHGRVVPRALLAGAVAAREHVLVAGAALRVDEDAAAFGDIQAGIARQGVAGREADGDDDLVRLQRAGMRRQAHAAQGQDVDAFEGGAEQELRACLPQTGFEPGRRFRRKESIEQGWRAFDHRHSRTGRQRGIGDLEAEKAATEDRDLWLALEGGAKSSRIVERAHVVHVRSAHRGTGQRAGFTACGKQAHVVREHLAVGKANRPAGEIEGDRLAAALHIDVAPCPDILGEDIEARLLGRHQHGFGQRGTLVRLVGLPPEHRDATAVAVFAQRVRSHCRSLPGTHDDNARRGHF